MKESKNTLRSSAQGLSQWLTEPAIEIVEPGQRRQAQLLSTLLIVMTLLDVLAILVVSPMTAGFDSHSLRDPIFLLDLGLVVVFGFAYALSRTRHYKWGAALTLLAAWVIPSFAAFLSSNADVLLMYTAMVVLLGSVFLGTRGLVLLAVIVSASISFFPILRPDMTRQAISIPLFFVAVTSVLIIVFVRHRDQVERDRQVELAQANLIVENSPVVLFRWKAAVGWPVELVSQNVIRFGYTPQELLSGAVPYARLVHPDDLERIAREVREYSASGVDHFQQEYQMVAKDGQVYWVDDRTVVGRDADGNITHYQGIVVDITARKYAGDELRANEDRFRALVQHLADVITIHTPEGTISYESPSAARVLGHEPGHLIGKNPFEFIHPDDQAIVQQALSEVVQRTNLGTPTEFRFRRGDGAWIYLEAVGTNLMDHPGIRGIVITSRDVTKRKRAEEALRVSEEKFSKAFRSSPDVISISSLQDGRFVEINEGFENLLGYRREEVIGRTALELNTWRHPEDRRAALAALETQRQIRGMEVEYRTKSGRLITCLLSAEVIELNGEPCLLAVSRDITERKQAEEALKRFAEQTQQRADLLAMLNEVGRAVSTLQDLGSMLEVILEQVRRNLPLDAFYVCLYDAETDLVTFPIFYDNGQRWREPVGPLDKHSRIAQVIRTGQPIQVSHTPAEVEQALKSDALLGDRSKAAASTLMAPMQVGQHVIGVISAQSYVADAYTDDHAALLASVAHQAAIAIRNARLYEQTQQRAERLAMLNEMSRAVSTLRDLDSVLEIIYQQAQRSLPLDVFFVALRKADTDEISFPIMYDSGQRWQEPPVPLVESGMTSRVIQSGEPRLTNRTAEELGRPAPAQLLLGDTTKMSASLMYAPLRAGEQVIGVISVQSYATNAYDQDDLALLVGIAHQAAIAIENARLYSAIQQELAERQRAEEALRASEERLRNIVENADEIIYTLSSDGVFTFVSPAWTRLLGHGVPEVEGHHLEPFVHPDDVLACVAFLDKVMTTGQPQRGIEYRVKHRDGTWRWHTSTGAAVKDAQGRPLYYVGMAQDITERKRSEQVQAAIYRISEAAQTAQNLDELFHSIHAIIGELMPARNFYIALYDAAADLFTVPYHVDEFDAPWPPYKPDKDMTTYVLRTGQPLLATPEVSEQLEQSGQVELIGAPSVDWLGVPLKTQRGETIGVMAVQTYTKSVRLGEGDKDVLGFVSTQVAMVIERKRAGEEIRRLNAELERRVVERTAQLEASNQELEAFSYSVSHDLRAPLRAIDGFSRLVLQDHGPQLPPEAQRDLHKVRSSAQRMGQLIDDLLAFSRLSRQPLDKRRVAPQDLVRQILFDLQSDREGRQVELVIGELPPCQGDAALLRQVWINLLSNALKFTQGRVPARIEIGCIEKDGEQVYFVRDNGVGFDMQYAAKLFGVFQRLHSAEEYEGTGVGLAIVQRIVHRHGGRIWAEADVDKGAAFYFTL